MIFMNVALAFGAAAFSIPLIIHLLNRSRFRTVQWGAMHLLESVIKTNHRRLQLDQLLLLLVRCAIPVLLALCLARPLLTGANPLAGDAPVSLVVVLDNSYSMNVADAGGKRFDRAISDAIELVNAAPQGSDISVILTGGRPTPLFDQPLFDREMITRRLSEIRAVYGASDATGSIQLAVETLSEMSHPRRELVLISDMQKEDWDASGIASLGQLKEKLDGETIPIFVSVLQMGESVEGNIAIESIEYPRQAFGMGEVVPVRVSAMNFGKSPVKNARISIKIDGKVETVSKLDLAANTATQTLFPLRFRNPGSHVIEASVATEDPLSEDNQRSAEITILDQLKVVLVNGSPHRQPLKNETGFLEVALTPFTSSDSRTNGGSKLTDLVSPITVLDSQLSQDSLENAKVVALANVRQLTDEQLDWVKDYVQSGGVLFVFPGNRIDVNWYRDRLYDQGKGLAPAAFGALRGKDPGSATRRQATGAFAARILSQHFDHPALEFFNDRSNGDLSTGRVFRWYDLENSAGVVASDQVAGDQRIVALLDNGSPLILEKNFGEGVVLQFATTCDSDWTDLPLQGDVFLPMMQQMVTTTASRLLPPRNISAGDAAVVWLDKQDDVTSLPIEMADGSRRTVTSRKEGNVHLARLSNTQQPGVYTVYKQNETVHFVANTSSTESNLRLLPVEEQDEVASSLGAKKYESANAYLKDDQIRRYGREIWRYLLAAFLAFLFLELVLQQKFSRVKT